jgi:hypothetical protein
MTTIKINIMNSEEMRKCSCCKCTQLLEYFKINRKGEYNKTCIRCADIAKKKRVLNRCIHGRTKTQCRECGGTNYCEHDKRKVRCVECGGASICEHKKERRRCKECQKVKQKKK